MTDFAKSGREDVKHKAADKFEGIQLQNFPSVAVAVISPGKCNGMILYLHDTRVRNGNAMSITPQIINDLGGIFKWWLAVNNPVLVVKLLGEREASQL